MTQTARFINFMAVIALVVRIQAIRSHVAGDAKASLVEL